MILFPRLDYYEKIWMIRFFKKKTNACAQVMSQSAAGQRGHSTMSKWMTANQSNRLSCTTVRWDSIDRFNILPLVWPLKLHFFSLRPSTCSVWPVVLMHESILFICLSVFQGKCRSKSMYSLQSAAVEQECVCCAAVKTEPLSVPVLCANGTRSHHTVQSVTTCDCVSKHCN